MKLKISNLMVQMALWTFSPITLHKGVVTDFYKTLEKDGSIIDRVETSIDKVAKSTQCKYRCNV